MKLVCPIGIMQPGQDAEFLLIECTPSGFQAVDCSTVPSGGTKRVNLTPAGSKLAVAKKAYDAAKRGIAEEHINTGVWPSLYDNYAAVDPEHSIEISWEQAEALNNDIFGELHVPKNKDPRKVEAQKRAVTREERDRRALIDGFVIALNDTTAQWAEFSDGSFIEIEKSGGMFTFSRVGSTAPLDPAGAPAAKRVAQELGGAFKLTGFFNEHGAFVCVPKTIDAETLTRISRGRPNIVRRARLYLTYDERICAIKDILAGRISALFVQSAHPEAYRYADARLTKNDLLFVLPKLPTSLHEALNELEPAPV